MAALPGFAPESLILPAGPGRLLLYQPALRLGTAVSHAALQALLDGAPVDAEVEAADVSAFSLERCLHDNSRGTRDAAGAALARMPLAELRALLGRQGILAVDSAHLERRGKKRLALDPGKLGNFHQQIGASLARRKLDPESWWVDQKFESDRSGFRDTPYRWCQEPFLGELFAGAKGQTWLDFGCGVGFYARRIAAAGGRVFGVDPSEAYVAAARALCPEGEFEALRFESREDFARLKDRRFDRIFLSDVLLYFFEPYAPLGLSAADVLSELAGRLAPGGRLLVLDPHGAFFLQPRLGSPEAPLALCTEYRTRRFRATPTLEELSRAVEAAGLKIARIRELFAPPAPGAGLDRRFAEEFPAWWFFELLR
ncbi:MAG: class I SAM-dependent methyltransferase [Elusimicrobia bacterium]|nr:class I SAM-dependent methyltransferase [Elusimicrobiota bacterium]